MSDKRRVPANEYLFIIDLYISADYPPISVGGLVVVLTLARMFCSGSMEHLNEKLRYNRLLKNRNADLTAFLFFLDFKAPNLSGTIERKVAVSL